MDKIFIVFPECTFSIFRLHLVDIENEKTFFHSINIKNKILNTFAWKLIKDFLLVLNIFSLVINKIADH